MNSDFSGLLRQVRQKNHTVDRMMESEGTVNDWITRQRKVLTHNSEKKSSLSIGYHGWEKRMRKKSERLFP